MSAIEPLRAPSNEDGPSVIALRSFPAEPPIRPDHRGRKLGSRGDPI